MERFAPIHIIKGSDDVILNDEVSKLLNELLGDDDRTLVLAELSIDNHLDGDDYSVGQLVDAAQTAPFLTDRRVILSRHSAVFSNKDLVAPLVAYLADPLPTSVIVMVWEKDPRPNKSAKTAALPKSLIEAVESSGGIVHDVSVSARDTDKWIDEQLKESELRLDAAARAYFIEHVGTDVARVRALIATLESVFGPKAKVSVADIEPYMGQAGDVAPWDLTDAIEKGDAASAIAVAHRMMNGGDRHPLQLLATLTNHYMRIFRVDDPSVANQESAAAVLGIKGSTFPAKKALDASRQLGSERLCEIAQLLAQADLDLRGATTLEAEFVLEILIARLAGRHRTSRRR